VDHLFVFEGAGNIRDFPGNYSQYRIWQKQEETRLKQQGETKAVKKQPAENNAQPEQDMQGKKESVAKKVSYKEKREFDQLEAEIAELETEKAGLEEALGNANLAFEQLSVHSKRIAEIIALLEEKELRWLELSELME
jgi:ATP-binding cassette subfamily F protein uup